jgi:DNA-binding winged helix-turn-helix (wHTH) protein/TolB-like protein/Tfp pilus assembly protein PilF
MDFEAWMSSTRSYKFLGYQADMLQRQLRDPEGRVVELSARAFDTLVYLLEHPGEDLGKDRLMAAVWPDSIVEENSLSQAISGLRRALGDQRTAPRFVMTVPGRGYRFIAEVSVSTDARPGGHAPGEGRRSWTWPAKVSFALAAGLASVLLAYALTRGTPDSLPPAPPTNTLAVLPFTSLLPGHADPALELGMADALIAHIGALPGLVVRPVSVVRRFATPDQDPLGAGIELGVGTVLVGSIYKDGEVVRVTSRLLDVHDGQSLWAGRYEVPISAIFELQDEMGNAILATLAEKLGTEPASPARPRATTNPVAYQSYLNGVYNRQRHDLAAAAADFSAAVQEDPEYALAWAALSSMLAAQAAFNLQPPEAVFPQARDAALRGVELDGSLADAKAALGHVLMMYDRQYADGETLFREARELNPDAGLIRLWTSINYLHLGRTEEALEEARRAQSLEPGTLPFAANVAMVLYYNRAYDAAMAELERVLALHPGFDHARSLLGRVLLQQGDVAGALAHFEARRNPSPGSFGDIGRAYAATGRRAEAYAEIDFLRTKAADGYGVAYEVASVHVLLGEFPQACAALSEALHDRSMGLGFLGVDPVFDRLRDHPCYEGITRQLYGGLR